MIARTAREFADAGLAVIVECDDCGLARRVDPELLVFVVGETFDMLGGLVELRQQLRCECCGRQRRSIHFEQATGGKVPVLSAVGMR